MSNTAETRFTLKHPELGTGPIPTDIYWKEDFYERELEAIFRRAWLWAGRVEQVAKPGAFFVKSIPTFDASILITRTSSEAIKAYHNTCQHRGNHVELSSEGNCRVFTCPFHGWSYNLDGELAGVPDSDAFYDLDRSSLSLPEVSVDVWEGFIFINLQESPNETLEEFLGKQGRNLSGYPFEKGKAVFSYEGQIDTNWKCMVDSFTEAYHVPVLHKRSVKDSFCGPNNPHGRLLDVDLSGHHRKISVAGNPEYQPRPVQGLAYRFSPGAAVTSGDGGQSENQLPENINPTKDPSWVFDIAVFFPNLLLFVGGGMHFLHQIWPLSANNVHWEMRGFLREAQTAAERFGQENSIVELRDAVLEDTNTLERIQIALKRQTIREFIYHDHELALRYNFHTVNRWVQEYEKEAP
tara:strand:- start:527 stop:1753 length:1227 start_codon:yes stop_codon:yes gene_type:complete